jgi:6-phospho-3-hexuloisomerase
MDNFKYISCVETLRSVLEDFDFGNLQKIADMIDTANNVFVVGRGRSRQTAMNFGSRLSQIRDNVYVVGGPTAPAAKPGDLLVLSSGSGRTGTLVDYADICKKLSIDYVLFTASPDSVVAKNATSFFLVLQKTKEDFRKLYGEFYAYYDYPTFLAFETILLYLMRKHNLSKEAVDANRGNLL